MSGDPVPTAGGVHIDDVIYLIKQIEMLTNYISASPGLSLADIKLDDTTSPGTVLDGGGILARVSRMKEAILPPSNMKLKPEELGFLQLARDALVRKAWPASGLTVAFTALVSSKSSKSRADLAAQAYPDLPPLAWRMRISRDIMLGLAIVVTLIAGWESAKVALGYSLLQSMEGLRSQQAAVELQMYKMEASLDDKPDTLKDPYDFVDDFNRVKPTAFSLCNRPFAIAYYLQNGKSAGLLPSDPGSVAAYAAAKRKAEADRAPLRDVDLPTLEPLKMYNSSPEREVCEKSRNLGFRFELLHDALKKYREDWPNLAGSVFSLAAPVIHFVKRIPYSVSHWVSYWFSHWFLGSKEPADASADQGNANAADAACDCTNGKALDVEAIIAPVLLVWSNYLLPVIFGLLGSNIFVVLDLFNKIRASTLHPRDAVLSWIRLVLGMVTGACIGLFFSGSGPTPGASGASLVGGLTLTASGLAFLAGFGVEGVFTMLEGLVRQAFPGTVPARTDR